MCQVKSDGGRRCPVHRHDSLAAIKHVADITGLERGQVEKLFKELREEARSLGRGNADTATWNDYMASLEEDAQGQTVVVKNISKAREGTNPPSKPTMYALHQLKPRAVQRRVALQRELNSVALLTGKPENEVAGNYKSDFRKAANTPMSPEEALQLYKKNLPVDSRTAAALRSISEVEKETTPRVQHQDVSDTSSALSTIGYDPDDGRLEVSFQNNPGQVYSYRNVPSDVWDAFSRTGSMYVYSKLIRSNEHYAYASAEDAEEDAYRVRCGACGQFRARAHQCPEKAAQRPVATVPVVLSEADIAAAQTGKVYLERWDVPADVTANPLNPTEEELYKYLDTREALSQVRKVYTVADSEAAISCLKQTGEVVVPVKVEMIGRITVEGTVSLAKDPQGLMSAITTDHALKCSCPDYQEHYDCKHVRALKDQGPAYLHHGDPEYINTDDSNRLDFEADHADRLDELTQVRAFARQNNLDGASHKEIVSAYMSAQTGLEEDTDEEDADEVVHAEDSPFYQAMLTNPRKARADILRHRQSTELAEIHKRNEENYRAYREEMLARLDDRDPGYGNDPDRFVDDYQAALKADIPYEYENVLDGAAGSGPGAIRFGVELEFSVEKGYDYNTVMVNIGRELHQAGLTGTPEMQDYHAATKSGWKGWSFEKDPTVDAEIVSPPLDDSPESWQQLETVCNIVRRNGGKVDTKSGSHIHVSTGSYGLNTAKHTELVRGVSEHQDVLYRGATNPFARSKRHRGIGHCAPNVNDPNDDVPLGVEESTFVLEHDLQRTMIINTMGSGHVDASKSHTEFRVFDGSLHPGTIQQQVKMSVALTEHAERQAILNGGSKKRPQKELVMFGDSIQKEREILAAAGTKKHTRETLIESNKPTMKFLDEVFRRDVDRKSVLAVLARNSWQRL